MPHPSMPGDRRNSAAKWAWAEAQHHIDAAKDSLSMGYSMDSVAHSLIAISLIQTDWLEVERGSDG